MLAVIDFHGLWQVIWVSIVGVLPFTLILPHANLFWTGILTVVIGMTLASASSAIIGTAHLRRTGLGVKS